MNPRDCPLVVWSVHRSVKISLKGLELNFTTNVAVEALVFQQSSRAENRERIAKGWDIAK